jgi:hypothetical protein
MNITLEIPEKVLKNLQRKAKIEDLPLDEIIMEVLINQTNDPEIKAEAHYKLSEKYLREGDELLSKGDYVQASEKFWGAASQILKSVAARRGEDLRSHSELHKYVAKLRKETGDQELGGLWLCAASLHQNFYEAWLPPEMVKDGIENVKKFIEKMKKL